MDYNKTVIYVILYSIITFITLIEGYSIRYSGGTEGGYEDQQTSSGLYNKHCCLIRNRGTSPSNLKEFDEITDSVVESLNVMMKNSNICFRFQYEKDWTLGYGFDYGRVNETFGPDRYTKVKEECYVSYIEFTPIYHYLYEKDPYMDIHIFGHASLKNDVHMNAEINWSTNYTGTIADRDRYFVETILMHEILHTVGMDHIGNGLMSVYYNNIIDVYDYDFSEDEANSLISLYGYRTAYTCKL